MIELILDEQRDLFRVVIDATELDPDVGFGSLDKHAEYDDKPTYRINVTDCGASRTIIRQQLSDLPGGVTGLSFKHRKLLPDLTESEDFHIIRNNAEHFLLIFSFSFPLATWKRLWSASEYADELRQLFTRNNIVCDKNEPGGELELSIDFPVYDNNFTIEAVVLKLEETLHTLHGQAVRNLEAKVWADSVVIYVDFPEEVRVPCEQYLVYFVQFLKDLGVEATADIQHEAGQMLFAVTPINKQTALDKIRTALEVYLRLPSNPASYDSGVEYEVALQRLAANVDHLKAQLRLAHAELRLANATIQTQQVTINQLLGGEIVFNSLKELSPKSKEEDKEALLDGVVALTKVNWKGVEFNLPEIFRRLRRMFRQ